jgi:hypothetical protein
MVSRTRHCRNLDRAWYRFHRISFGALAQGDARALAAAVNWLHEEA